MIILRNAVPLQEERCIDVEDASHFKPFICFGNLSLFYFDLLFFIMTQLILISLKLDTRSKDVVFADCVCDEYTEQSWSVSCGFSAAPSLCEVDQWGSNLTQHVTVKH